MIAAAILITAMAQTPVSFTTIQKGPLSGIDTARQVVVRSEAEWKTLWREHQPDREEPTVDFSRSIIVALFMGSRRTAGYGIEVTRVERTGDDLTVFYRQTTPPPDAMTAQVITAPFHIIQVNRAPGDVRFELDRSPSK